MILAAAALALCPPPPAQRVTCVVDGDTAWIAREKFRLADIDAPELDGRCERERRLARQARARLAVLLDPMPRVQRVGTDRYGRTLARIGNAGEVLIREGLAVRWPSRKDWC